MEGMRKFLCKNNERGFTLVEVIVSVAVLCLVCGIILRLFVTSDDLRENNLDIEKAQVAVSNMMEQLKSSDEPLPADMISEPDFDGSLTLTQYYDSEWKSVQSGDNPRFVLTTVLRSEDEGLYTEGSFGNSGESNPESSMLYEISISIRDVERARELASIVSAHYYRNMGVDHD